MTATTSALSMSSMILIAARPIRPRPLMATLAMEPPLGRSCAHVTRTHGHTGSLQLPCSRPGTGPGGPLIVHLCRLPATVSGAPRLPAPPDRGSCRGAVAPGQKPAVPSRPRGVIFRPRPCKEPAGPVRDHRPGPRTRKEPGRRCTCMGCAVIGVAMRQEFFHLAGLPGGDWTRGAPR